MLAFIYKNKLKYEKGQLAPFFIALVAILIILTFVTVNLSKVALFKTDTANAADAGALAGGSAMAGVFNGQAVMNSYMIVAYQMFMANLAMSIALTTALMFMAAGACAAWPCCICCPVLCPCDCCCPAPGCPGPSIGAIVSIISIMAYTIFFYMTQLNFLKLMKKQAEQGRHQAIQMGFRYAFYNSGIGGKLISGEPPEEVEKMRGDKYNYRDTFDDFLKDKLPDLKIPNENGSVDYLWLDGQKRNHDVRVEVFTQGISYEIKTSILPVPAVIGLFAVALYCIEGFPGYCACCPLASGAMFGLAAQAAALLLAGWAGLLPGGSDGMMGLPCWVQDIKHDRLLKVKTWQAHQGQGYGIWQTAYPKKWEGSTEPQPEQRIESFSVVDFRGNGKIYKPKPKFDASIVRTD